MVSLRGALRIDTDANADIFTEILIFSQLRKGIKDHVVTDFYQLPHILLFISRGKNMVLFSHLLFSEACLIKPARRRSTDILSNQRVFIKAGKRFLREKDFTSGILLYLPEDGKIILQLFFIYDITWCL